MTTDVIINITGKTAISIGQPGLAEEVSGPELRSKAGLGVILVADASVRLVTACLVGLIVGVGKGCKGVEPAEVCLVVYQYWIICWLGRSSQKTR